MNSILRATSLKFSPLSPERRNHFCIHVQRENFKSLKLHGATRANRDHRVRNATPSLEAYAISREKRVTFFSVFRREKTYSRRATARISSSVSYRLSPSPCPPGLRNWFAEVARCQCYQLRGGSEREDSLNPGRGKVPYSRRFSRRAPPSRPRAARIFIRPTIRFDSHPPRDIES